MSRSELDGLDQLKVFYSRKIGELLDRPDISTLVRDYLNPAGPYAATSFDGLLPNPPEKFISEDFLAIGFLDTPIKAATFRQFGLARDRINGLLSNVDSDASLWNLSDSIYAAANSLWEELLMLDGVGVTRASKMMARKRPRLIPILDRRVKDFYEGRTESFWWPLALALRQDALLGKLNALKDMMTEARELSELRILDIAIWMGERNPPGTASPMDD